MTTPLQLDGYYIDRFDVAALAGFKPKRGDIDVEINVSPGHYTSIEDPRLHQIVLDVAFKPRRPGSAPYKGRIVGRAFFKVAEELDESAAARYLLLNGSAILFGLLRAHVAQTTALGRWGAFLLPTVNLVEAFQRNSGPEQEEE
ncbi:MAG: protein-export chaperone SecB [Anaerosomatales bacterium]|nr:protein-export chaperone SecB [Anaerosomatales bacterium]